MSAVTAPTRPIITGGNGFYRVTWEDEGITITASRVREKSDGAVTAELEITSTQTPYPHLRLTRLNLLSARARKALAQDLEQIQPIAWEALLEQLAVYVVRREREGEPWHRISSEGEIAPIQWLLRPLLVEGNPTVIVGPGGSGKSYATLFIATLVATGKRHPRIPLEPQKRAPVLLLDWEAEHREVERRLRRLAKGMGFEEPVEVVYRRCAQPLADDLEAVQAAVTEYEPGLIVVDSMGPAVGGDLLSAQDSTRFFAALRRLGVTSLVVAHTPKSGNGIYGTTFHRNLARSVWEAHAYSVPGEDAVALGLFHVKANVSGLQRPIGLEFQFDGEDGAVRVLPREVTDIPVVKERAPLKDRILGLLPRTGPLSIKELASHLDGNYQAVKKALYRLEERGRVVHLGDGRWGAASPEEEVPF